MAKFNLKENEKKLEVGWKVKLVAEFEPVAECREEAFWVRVESADEINGVVSYSGIVDDYLTYVRSHGITQGFMIQFNLDNVCEVRKQ